MTAPDLGLQLESLCASPHGRRITPIRTPLTMMSILGTILIGFVVGLLARALKPGDDKLGWIMTTLLGIAGSFVASYVGQAMHWYRQGEAAGWIASVVGAFVLLFIVQKVRGSSSAS